MFDFFQYEFIVRALLTGFVAAIGGAVLGNFLVAGRKAVVSDMLSHTALAGVGLGVFLGISPMLAAPGVAIMAAGLLFYFGSRQQAMPEAVSVLLLSGGIALAVLFVHLAENPATNLERYLFGSILTVSTTEAIRFTILNATILLLVMIFGNRLLSLTFDRDFFVSRFRYASLLESTFLAMVAVFVAFSLNIIGGLLITGLLVIPVLCAQRFAKSFWHSVIISACIGTIGVTGGIISSFWYDIPTTSAIILGLIAIFMFTQLLPEFSAEKQ
jgi:zinc transport system permease protein